jgi:hypothetical protein
LQLQRTGGTPAEQQQCLHKLTELQQRPLRRKPMEKRQCPLDKPAELQHRLIMTS